LLTRTLIVGLESARLAKLITPTKPAKAMMLSRNQGSCLQPKKSPSAGCWPGVLIILMSSSAASCAVKATLGFWYSYLNAWELYFRSLGGRKKVSS
jgi:hypothetical protein